MNAQFIEYTKKLRVTCAAIIIIGPQQTRNIIIYDPKDPGLGIACVKYD